MSFSFIKVVRHNTANNFFKVLLLSFFTVLMERNHRAEKLLIDLRARYNQVMMGKRLLIRWSVP